MEFFIDGWCVRLQSRLHGWYLHAAEDGVGVCLRPERASLKAAWMVQRLERDGTNYALLRSAAYGRYLAFEPAQLTRFVQRSYDHPEQDHVLWEVVGAGERGGDVFILHARQTPGPWPWYWYLGFAVGNHDDAIPSLYWMVDVLVPRLEPPALPAPPPAQLPNPGVEQPVQLSRVILYMLGDDLGNCDEAGWQKHLFSGQSVYKLREELASLLHFANSNDTTLCTKAGHQGRLTPLSIDLPANEERMEIVVLLTSTVNSEDLRLWLWHPDVDRV